MLSTLMLLGEWSIGDGSETLVPFILLHCRDKTEQGTHQDVIKSYKEKKTARKTDIIHRLSSANEYTFH